MKKHATREAYGDALVEMMDENPNIVALDADLASCTKGCRANEIAPLRHFDLGIAESNMMAVAAGLAASGKIAFASTFAMFASGRAFEQIRNSIAYPGLNVKICATHAGISVGEDGATHQCIEDISLMRTIPGMQVIVPSDYKEAKEAIKYAASHPGPFYIRLGRNAVKTIYEDDHVFEMGKGDILKEGDSFSSIVLIACGSTVQECLKAYEKLAVKPMIVNMSTLCPIDQNLIENLGQRFHTIITVEDHLVTGGLGSAVAEILAQSRNNARLVRLGIQNSFGESGKADELYRKYGIDSAAIIRAVKQNTESLTADPSDFICSYEPLMF